ncbi:hypothetical protein [Alienimonas chondri]|uniref:Uncharacterized protein n=1 Tax=Alienimonas chondri TaxID=2681879 RepID=A0ABX1VFK3_9PLAN|nr:hypothetical protein [Alienimonas chondri]NNJ26300.1 hypothetical protein [Alienimonas chondri]
MDAWIRPALLCATMLSVSAAPDPEPTELAPPTEAPVAAEPDLSEARTAGFDGAFRAATAPHDADAAELERTAARAGQGRHRTKNFLCYAKDSRLAREVCMEAERQREVLAIKWLGKTIPDWPEPCPITVTACFPGKGAGGATTFGFHTVRKNGRTEPAVGGFRMQVEGSRERLLDSVIPHEVNHTIFASYFRKPLPRWADEGAATLTEFKSERMRQRNTLVDQWQTHRYRVSNLITQTEYPGDPRNPGPGDAAKVMQVYAQGYSLADYLVQRGGKAAFLKSLEDASRQIPGGGRGGIDWEYPLERWDASLQKHFGMTVKDLEKEWHGWVMAGCQPLSLPDGVQLAGNRRDGETPVRTATSSRPAGDGSAVRAQSPDESRVASGRRVAAADSGADSSARTAIPGGSFADSRPATSSSAPRSRPAPIDSFVPYRDLVGRDR